MNPFYVILIILAVIGVFIIAVAVNKPNKSKKTKRGNQQQPDRRNQDDSVEDFEDVLLTGVILGDAMDSEDVDESIDDPDADFF